MNKAVLTAAAAACMILSACAAPAPEPTAAETSHTATPAPTSATVATPAPSTRSGKRDWIAELLAIGYLPGKDNGQWLDARMIRDAPQFCTSSLTDAGDNASARLWKHTAFEQEILDRAKVSNKAEELGYSVKVVERFCPKRLDALDMVLEMHPELPAPKGRL